MKYILLAAIIGLAGASGAAAEGLQFGEQGFPGSPAPSATTWQRSCAQIQSLVGQNRHAILTYRSHGYDPRNLVSSISTFGSYGTNRVVLDQRYCLRGELAQPIWVRTSDSAACFAGFTCDSGNSSGRRR